MSRQRKRCNRTTWRLAVLPGALLGLSLAMGACGQDPALTLQCPRQLTVVISTPGQNADLGLQVTGSSGEVTFSSDVSLSQAGTGTATITATDGAGQRASCTLELELLAAYAPQEARIISARVQNGDTHAVLAWDVPAGTSGAGIRIEASETAEGPWTTLATATMAARTYELPPVATSPGRRFFRAITESTQPGLDGGTSAAIVVYAVRADGYNLSQQPVAGIPFATSLYGVVRYPQTTEAKPLVLLLHGNHENCSHPQFGEYCETTTAHECSATAVANAEGYIYLLETFAAQGYVAVSISANALNCRNDFIPQRIALLLEHMRLWQRFAGATPQAPYQDGRFQGRVDFSEVHVMGHSRGGEAASSVPKALATTPIAGVSLASAVAVAPTDFYQPTPTSVPFAVVLPGCDGDVYTLAGRDQYDRTRPTLGAHRGQWLLPGANHNFFNTTWVNDDGEWVAPYCAPNDSHRLQPAAQRAILEDLLGQWLAAKRQGPSAWLRAEIALPTSTAQWMGQTERTRMSYMAAQRLAIDNFADPLATNDLGLSNTFNGLGAPLDMDDVDTSLFEHVFAQVRAMRVALNGPVQGDEARFAVGALDLTAARAISLRVAVRHDSVEALASDAPPAFTITLRDAAGTAVSFASGELATLAPLLPFDVPREVLQTVRVPVSAIVAAEPSFMLSQLASISFAGPLELPGVAFWLANLELDQDP